MKSFYIQAILFVSSFLILSCNSDDKDEPDEIEFTTIVSLDDAKLISGTLDSLELHTYQSLDVFGKVPNAIVIDSTLSGNVGGTAHIKTSGRTSLWGGHCGGTTSRWGTFNFELTNYEVTVGTVVNNAGLISYNCVGNEKTGVCFNPITGLQDVAGYQRKDTLTIESPSLSISYDNNGTHIRDEIEVKAVYLHSFSQLWPYQQPRVTLDSTVTRKYYIKTSNGSVFEW